MKTIEQFNAAMAERRRPYRLACVSRPCPRGGSIRADYQVRHLDASDLMEFAVAYEMIGLSEPEAVGEALALVADRTVEQATDRDRERALETL